MYLKLCLIIVLAFFYYSSLTNEDDDYENDDDNQSDVTKLQKNKQRKTLAQLKKQRSKALAGGFVLEESDVTYRAPKGFYGDFGVAERNVQGKATMHEDNEDEVEEAGSSGSSTEKVVIKKPKTGSHKQ